MAALGARCSIGDQLHPCGKIDADTYKRIAPAYRRIQTLEPFLENATPVSDIGIISAEAHHRDRACEPSDIGAARILLESQQMFALLDWDSSLEDYRVLILPDSIRLSESQASRLQAYLDGGGAILSTGHSLLDTDNSEFAIECGVLCEGDRTFQPDYVAASADLQGPFSMVASPFVIYNRGISLHPTKARPLAHLHDPYFNRSWRHFCSHQHTPCQVEQNATLSAAVRYQSIIHFAHPLFKEYHQSGQPLTKALLLNGLRLLLPDPPIRSNLPTSARLSWMRQTGLNRDVLHVLFAQTQLRGTGLPAWNGTNAMEIIEDVVSLSDITVDIRPSKPLRTAYSAYQPHQPLHLEPLDNGSVRIRLAHLLLHEAIVLQYA
jgi:hypothetical protein